MTVSLKEEDQNAEYSVMFRRMIGAVILTVSLAIVAMRDMIPGAQVLEKYFSSTSLAWAEFLLATPVVLWAGWLFFFLSCFQRQCEVMREQFLSILKLRP